jgi:hypothetical protein
MLSHLSLLLLFHPFLLFTKQTMSRPHMPLSYCGLNMESHKIILSYFWHEHEGVLILFHIN